MLNRFLTPSEVDYVFFHLSHHLKGFDALRPHINYSSSASKGESDIWFYATSDGLDASGLTTIAGVPILFPGVARCDRPWSMTDGVLRFHHDLIKSAFFLLSGYQEWELREKNDAYHRLPYELSVQYKLNLIHKPLVNYYFKWIIDGLLHYCDHHSIALESRRIFGRMGLFLSHDIDLLRYDDTRKVAHRLAQLAGFRRREYGASKLIKSVSQSLGRVFRLLPQENPYWSFAKILNTERHFGFTSSWYFLKKVGGVFDADYRWDDSDVAQMIGRLSALGQEVGLHGSLKSSTNEGQFTDELYYMEEMGIKVRGVRMHFLSFKQPDTIGYMEQLGVEYDTSLGFSRMEGFRHSYCHPFRLFDHRHGRMSQVWEIPLVAMDTTLLEHRKMSFDDIFNALEPLLDEVSSFGGVFSLLWHNSTFDEYKHPGILKFYEDLHLYFSQYSPLSLRGVDIVERMESIDH